MMEGALNLLCSLRQEKWNVYTETYLSNHPLLQENKTTQDSLLKAVEIFALEQSYITRKDLESMMILAERFAETRAAAFYKEMIEGEKIAIGLLKDLVKKLGFDKEHVDKYSPKEGAQGYPNCLRTFAETQTGGAVAVAFAINFPVYGRMCGRFRESIIKTLHFNETDTNIFEFVSTPIPHFDDKVAEILQEDLNKGLSSDKVREVVQGLQEQEIKFWDTVYSASLKIQ